VKGETVKWMVMDAGKEKIHFFATAAIPRAFPPQDDLQNYGARATFSDTL